MPRYLAAILCAFALSAFVLPSSEALAADQCDGIAPVAGSALTAYEVVSGLTSHPIFVTSPPGDLGRYFVVEQTGYVRVHHIGDPPTQNSRFLNIANKVQST